MCKRMQTKVVSERRMNPIIGNLYANEGKQGCCGAESYVFYHATTLLVLSQFFADLFVFYIRFLNGKQIYVNVHTFLFKIRFMGQRIW